MAPIVSSVDINRPPAEVYDYVTDPARFGEWQSGVVSSHNEPAGPAAVGARCVMTRTIGGKDRTSVSEITAASPPAAWAIRGIDGPIRANVSVRVEPRDTGSRVTISLEFSGHGAGRLILPVVNRQAQQEVPASCAKLKERLER
jgi:hypothetical protein